MTRLSVIWLSPVCIFALYFSAYGLIAAVLGAGIATTLLALVRGLLWPCTDEQTERDLAGLLLIGAVFAFAVVELLAHSI